MARNGRFRAPDADLGKDSHGHVAALINNRIATAYYEPMCTCGHSH